MTEGMFAGFEFGMAADLILPPPNGGIMVTNDAPFGLSIESAEVVEYLWRLPDAEMPLTTHVAVPGEAVEMILPGVVPPYDILKRTSGAPGWRLIYEVRPTASGYVVCPVAG